MDSSVHFRYLPHWMGSSQINRGRYASAARLSPKWIWTAKRHTRSNKRGVRICEALVPEYKFPVWWCVGRPGTSTTCMRRWSDGLYILSPHQLACSVGGVQPGRETSRTLGSTVREAAPLLICFRHRVNIVQTLYEKIQVECEWGLGSGMQASFSLIEHCRG